MNLAMNWIRNTLISTKIEQVFTISVRNYEKKPYGRRYGYTDKIFTKGLLPRSKDFGKIKSLPTYRPKNAWTEKRALFGQNDYIDILGNGTVHPSQLLTEIPRWLRGFRGNELQMLQRRMKHLGDYYKELKPTKLYNTHKRLRRVCYYLNHKTNSAR